ncbi:hypothetical protein BaRGS_00005843 [Batillaria attramentaria]|uniref:Uncharacterized protein n=1 Tax=Batillaria attramentaria TaxID=370345 RepID=A0ABD0LTF3_9CAEN
MRPSWKQPTPSSHTDNHQSLHWLRTFTNRGINPQGHPPIGALTHKDRAAYLVNVAHVFADCIPGAPAISACEGLWGREVRGEASKGESSRIMTAHCPYLPSVIFFPNTASIPRYLIMHFGRAVAQHAEEKLVVRQRGGLPGETG